MAFNRGKHNTNLLIRHISPQRLSEFGAMLIRDGASLIRNVATSTIKGGGGSVSERQSSPEPSELSSIVNDDNLATSDLSTIKKTKKQPKQMKTKQTKQTKTKQLNTKETKTKVLSKQKSKQLKSVPIKKSNLAQKKKSSVKNIFDD